MEENILGFDAEQATELSNRINSKELEGILNYIKKEAVLRKKITFVYSELSSTTIEELQKRKFKVCKMNGEQFKININYYEISWA